MSSMIGKYELLLHDYSGRGHHYHDCHGYLNFGSHYQYPALKVFLVKSSLPDVGEVDVVGPAGPRRGGEGSC